MYQRSKSVNFKPIIIIISKINLLLLYDVFVDLIKQIGGFCFIL